MVCLKTIVHSSACSVIIAVALMCFSDGSVEAAISKISYKKTVIGDKEKYQLPKIELIKSTPICLTSDTTAIPITPADKESSTDITLTLTPKEESLSLNGDFKSTTAMESTSSAANLFTKPTNTNAIEEVTVTATSDNRNKEKLPCTCGIFLSSQFSKGSAAAPRGEAVISNSLDRTFACNGVGQKQCQTKCLQQIVQHLPNSGNILCAALDRDVRKERAYLFIKNCENKWINTNLAAGREYCCKNREPCKCK